MFKGFASFLVFATIILPSVSVFAGPHGGGGGHGAPPPPRGGGGGGYDRHGGSDWRGGPVPWHRGICVPRLPGAYIALAVGGLECFYCAGLYYNYTASGYVVIEPPIGAVIPALPAGYSVVYMNGAPYYYYSNTYYTVAPSGGYVVVSPTVETTTTIVTTPATTTTTTVPATTATAVPAATTESDTFDVQIPNGNGSFTLVRLTKTKDGFLGPQGEFYQDHPTIEQLKARYVK